MVFERYFTHFENLGLVEADRSTAYDMKKRSTNNSNSKAGAEPK